MTGNHAERIALFKLLWLKLQSKGLSFVPSGPTLNPDFCRDIHSAEVLNHLREVGEVDYEWTPKSSTSSSEQSQQYLAPTRVSHASGDAPFALRLRWGGSKGRDANPAVSGVIEAEFFVHGALDCVFRLHRSSTSPDHDIMIWDRSFAESKVGVADWLSLASTAVEAAADSKESKLATAPIGDARHARAVLLAEKRSKPPSQYKTPRGEPEDGSDASDSDVDINSEDDSEAELDRKSTRLNSSHT